MNIAVLFSLLLLSQVIVENEKKLESQFHLHNLAFASFSLDLVGFSLPLGVDVSKAEDLKAFMPLTSMGKAT